MTKRWVWDSGQTLSHAQWSPSWKVVEVAQEAAAAVIFKMMNYKYSYGRVAVSEEAWTLASILTAASAIIGKCAEAMFYWRQDNPVKLTHNAQKKHQRIKSIRHRRIINETVRHVAAVNWKSLQRVRPSLLFLSYIISSRQRAYMIHYHARFRRSCSVHEAVEKEQTQD